MLVNFLRNGSVGWRFGVTIAGLSDCMLPYAYGPPLTSCSTGSTSDYLQMRRRGLQPASSLGVWPCSSKGRGGNLAWWGQACNLSHGGG